MTPTCRLAALWILAATGLALVISCAPAKTTRPADQATRSQRETTRAEGPAIEISADRWDFGTLERGRSATSEITVANQGTDSLRVSLHTACDCLTASIGSPVVPPGGSSSIHLTYLGDEVNNASSKTLYIDSNDSVRGRLTVTVSGKIVEGRAAHLVALPNPLPLDRGKIPGATGAGSDTAGAELGWIGFEQAALSIANRGGEGLVIAEVRCFGCTSDWTERVLQRGEEAVLHIDASPGWTGKRWIEIQSNDPVSPLKKVSLVEMD